MRANRVVLTPFNDGIGDVHEIMTFLIPKGFPALECHNFMDVP